MAKSKSKQEAAEVEKQAQLLLAKLQQALRKSQQTDSRIREQTEEMYEHATQRADEYRRLFEQSGGVLPQHVVAEYNDEIADVADLARQRGLWGATQ